MKVSRTRHYHIKAEINAIIKQCLSLPQTRLRKLLKRMDFILNLMMTHNI